MVVESDNTRMPRLNHADPRSGSESHFVQAPDEVGVSFDFENAPELTRMKEMQGNDLRHGARPIRHGEDGD